MENASKAVRVGRPFGILSWIAGLVVLAAIGVLAVAWSGLYNVGADSPHTRPVYWLLEMARNRSVAAHAESVLAPPDLDEQERIASGAGLYAEMCAGCHLAPGMSPTEIAQMLAVDPALTPGNFLDAADT